MEQRSGAPRINLSVDPSEGVFSPMKRLSGFFLLVLLSLCVVPIDAQSTAQPDPLFKTIQSLDTKLFDAYNHCDLTTLGAMVSDDLEFYHDQTGLSVGKEPFLAAIKQNICGK